MVISFIDGNRWLNLLCDVSNQVFIQNNQTMKTDEQIQRNVMEELKWEPFLNASEVGVAVTEGIVTLTGEVDTFSKKQAAENAAKRVLGVKAVAEEIEVRLPSRSKRTDTDLAQAILGALKWHSSVQEDKLAVKVENGWVTLEGDVEWEFQRLAAKNAIDNLVGVWGVTNNIKVIPKVSAKDIKQKINLAFHRSATIDSENVSVEAIGSKIILSGHVRSWVEKKDAEKAAWAAPGVTAVENRLEIKSEVLSF
jgi:osmotically-inducible protein OsmY